MIVEDEVIIGRDIQGMLEEIGYEVVGIARDVEGALKSLDYEMPDLVLIDIMLKGEKSGIDLAKHLRQHLCVPFIYVTSHANRSTVSEAITTKPNGYLVKPFTQDDLFASIELALSNHNESVDDRSTFIEGAKPAFSDSIFLKSGNLFQRIKYADVLYLEADGAYTRVVTKTKQFVERKLLQAFEDQLGPKGFLRIHRSYIVNVEMVNGLAGSEVIVDNKRIPLGRSYKGKLMRLIQQ